MSQSSCLCGRTCGSWYLCGPPTCFFRSFLCSHLCGRTLFGVLIPVWSTHLPLWQLSVFDLWSTPWVLVHVWSTHLPFGRFSRSHPCGRIPWYLCGPPACLLANFRVRTRVVEHHGFSYLCSPHTCLLAAFCVRIRVVEHNGFWYLRGPPTCLLAASVSTPVWSDTAGWAPAWSTLLPPWQLFVRTCVVEHLFGLLLVRSTHLP